MSNDPSQPEPAADTVADEQLVAYLDGELDDQASRRVEALLASDPKLRQQAVQLERSWEVLGHVSRFEVDERFTQSTLEMVAVAAEEEVRKQEEEAPQRTRRRWLLGSAALAAAVATGFLAATILWPDPNRRLLEDLPVLERFEQYRQIDDIHFLHELEDLFPETPDGE